MTEADRSMSALARSYYASFLEGGAGPNSWATEEVLELQQRDPEQAWTLTLGMLKESQDPLYTAYVAAGPLEDLLVSHGHRFIAEAETLALNEPWFSKALQAIYGQSRMSSSIYAKLQEILGATREPDA